MHMHSCTICIRRKLIIQRLKVIQSWWHGV